MAGSGVPDGARESYLVEAVCLPLLSSPLMFFRRPSAWSLAVLATVGCRTNTASAPNTSFVVSAGDSTYWVTTSATQAKVRSAPFLLVSLDGRFQEIFVTDDDQSFYNAVIIGQRIYMRDLVTGDSSLVLDDELTGGVAREYQRTHPNERPLDQDEEENPDAEAIASTDTQVIEVLGPYLTYEQHLDLDGPWLRPAHTTRRGVINLRTKEPVTLASLVGEGTAATLWTRGVSLFGSARDSIGSMADARAARAKEAMGGFEFDSSSFAVIESAGAPAIAFYVPGHGLRAGGYALPLDPIDIPAGTWWNDVRGTLPVAEPGGSDIWHGRDYDVVARYDSIDGAADLYVRPGGSEHAVHVARVQGPVRRVLRVVTQAGDTTTRALRRAFDDAVLYSGNARTASVSLSPHQSRLPTS
ncbi:MAG: hypothetical protein U0132_22520 [Gemmatimonadaceae bacterium]